MKTINIWNIKFNPLKIEEIVSCVQCLLDEGKKGIHLTGVNPETVVDAQDISLLRRAIMESDIVNIDNMLVVLILRKLGYEIPERAATPDVFEELLKIAEKRGQSVYFLGAEQGVLEKMIENIKRQYPKLIIAGYRNGFFSDEDEPEIVESIRALSPTYLFLGLPTPQKETFILKYKNVINAGVLYGVGGAFDVKGEKVGRAPEWLRNIGLEGFFRVLQNPKNYGKRIFKYYPRFIKLAKQSQ